MVDGGSEFVIVYILKIIKIRHSWTRIKKIKKKSKNVKEIESKWNYSNQIKLLTNLSNKHSVLANGKVVNFWNQRSHIKFTLERLLNSYVNWRKNSSSDTWNTLIVNCD